MRKELWYWALFLNLTGMLYAAVDCGGPDKPIVPANPVVANCITDRTTAQLNCVREAGTEKQADDCIAIVKAMQECVDGGR